MKFVCVVHNASGIAHISFFLYFLLFLFLEVESLTGLGM